MKYDLSDKFGLKLGKNLEKLIFVGQQQVTKLVLKCSYFNI